MLEANTGELLADADTIQRIAADAQRLVDTNAKLRTGG
jgi:hypothetical protein